MINENTLFYDVVKIGIQNLIQEKALKFQNKEKEIKELKEKLEKAKLFHIPDLDPDKINISEIEKQIKFIEYKKEQILIELENLKTHPKENFYYLPIDFREYNSLIPEYLSKIPNLLVLKVNLINGDYFISNRCIVERKRGDDFKQSMYNGTESTNINDELQRLTSSIDSPILLIEDIDLIFRSKYLTETDKKTIEKQIENKKRSIMLNFKVPIIYTIDEKESAKEIWSLVKYEQSEKRNGKGRNIPKTSTIEKRQEYFLQGFFDCGSVTSMNLLEHFDNPIEVIEALQNSQIRYSKKNNPQDLIPIDESKKSLQGIKGIGYKFYEKNHELLNKKRRKSK